MFKDGQLTAIELFARDHINEIRCLNAAGHRNPYWQVRIEIRADGDRNTWTEVVCPHCGARKAVN